MTLRQRFFNLFFGTETIHYNGGEFVLPTHTWNKDDPSTVSVATTCVKILAETLARMPLHVWKEDRAQGRVKDKGFALYDILHSMPNQYTNANSFFQTLEYHRNFRGNSFARIHRNGGSGAVNSLEIISPSRIKGYKVVKKDLFYEIEKDDDTRVNETVNHMEVLHFKMMSPDGVWGINPIAALALNMGVMYKGASSMDNFLENNALSPKALKTTVGASNVGRSKEVMKEFNEEYSGHINAGKWINLPPNTDIVDLQINFADAQLLDSLKFNSQQIAALWGVPVYMATGDFTQSKYNNIEQSQLSYKINTVAPIVKMYQAEFEMKLLTDKQRKTKRIEYNINSLVEPDIKTKTEYYGKMHQIGAMSAYQVATFEGLPLEEVQKELFVMTNMQPLKKALEQNDTGEGKDASEISKKETDGVNTIINMLIDDEGKIELLKAVYGYEEDKAKLIIGV